MNRRLVRSRTDRILGGVCGGLGAHFDCDPVIFRLLFILMTVMGGSGILIYLILWIAIPRAPIPAPEAVLPTAPDPAVAAGGSAPALPAGETPAEASASAARPRHGLGAGIILVVVGALFLASNLGLFWWWKWKVFWPVALIAVGLWLLIRRNGKE